MLRILACCVALLSATAGPTRAEEPSSGGAKLLSGMSVIGNDEAPKSLVIVPWKSAELGHSLDVSHVLDDGRQPVDRDVFARELHYYQLRAGSTAGRRPASQ